MACEYISIGDVITFKAATRSHFKTATRKVVSIDPFNRPCVRYNGWSDFAVQRSEISAIAKAKGS